MTSRGKVERTTHAKRGQIVTVQARAGVAVTVTHFDSGAVEVRNATTRAVLRVWAPKERDDR